jgi:four helix bundle protein
MTHERTIPFNFQERAILFAKRVRALIDALPKTLGNIEDGKQLIRSSGAIGANYIEAGEALSKRDALKSLRIARKEAKESVHWLHLIKVSLDQEEEREALLGEAREMVRILTAMIKKVE